ncbi:MAG: molecular chaperone DnaJ [Polyangiaceae bacterium]|nr:molecular chaperone DnaJ [Polyangiaceae bacterium]
MADKRDYYEVLGVPREASGEDLRKAFKREALKHHPDRNQGDANAEQLFKEVNEAYQVLNDPQKRQVYDRFGHEGLQGGGGFDPNAGDMFSHMQDLFQEMFSGGGFGFGGRQQRRAKGDDLRMAASLSLREAAFGVKRELELNAPAHCGDCGGSGAAAGTKPETCGHCKGSGQVSNARGFVMFASPCPKCEGKGSVIKTPCKTCRGQGLVTKARKVTVTFPAGVDNGQRLRVQGQGMPGPGGRDPGDLYVEIEVEDDPRFERDGADLVVRTHISFSEAALGAEIEVQALSPDSNTATKVIKIPSGTQSGTVFNVRGEGIPRLDGKGRGSLIVAVQVDVPSTLSAHGQKLLEELHEELRGHSLLARAKSMKG